MSDISRVMEVAAETTAAPVNIDAPAITSGDQVATTVRPGDVLTCTHGNWEGTPGSYDFRWRSDGADMGVGGPSYAVRSEDAGHTLDCMVTAINVGGTASVPSGGVSVEGGAT